LEELVLWGNPMEGLPVVVKEIPALRRVITPSGRQFQR